MRARPIANVVEVMNCPGEIMLVSYVRGELDEVSSGIVEQHLDRCPTCEVQADRLEHKVWESLRLTEGASTNANFLSERGAVAALRRVLEIARDNQERLQTQGRIRKSIPLAVGDEIDDFLILRNLGSGGFATVYLAQQKSMQRLVALKISQRRSHEAPVLSNLDHPHIVRVFDERGLPECEDRLLYMQYVAGGSLRHAIESLHHVDPERRQGSDLRKVISTHIESGGEISIPLGLGGLPATADWTSTVCWMGARIADALRYAHAKGYLHRDIKPANVLLAADGQPMLVDFNLSYGTAVVGADPEDCFGGSFAYMSPEQLEVHLNDREASEVGAASDVYSLGVVLWELLTGDRPHPGEALGTNQLNSLRAMLDRRRGEVSAADLPEFVPTELRRILVLLLAPDPAKRPDAAALARTLQLHSTADLCKLLAPAPTSWAEFFARWPIATLLVCALAPNVVIAPINIYWNQTFLQVDSEQLWNNLWLVNLLVFSIGIVATVLFARPLFRAIFRIRTGAALSRDEHRVAAERCLALPLFVASLCLLLWIVTGVAFPLLAIVQSGTRNTFAVVPFCTSQLVHGAIAAPLTFLTVALATMCYSFPKLVQVAPLPDLRTKVARLRHLVDWSAALLGLVPPFALMAMTSLPKIAHHGSNGAESLWLFFDLGVFGAASFALALAITPPVRHALATLQIALTPTEQLLYGDLNTGRFLS